MDDMPLPSGETELARVLQQLEALRDSINKDAHAIADRWTDWVKDDDFIASANNFAHYLAFRHHDLRPLQRELTRLGLCSLGTLEGRVLPTLDTIVALLRFSTAAQPYTPRAEADFYACEQWIQTRADALLGPLPPHRAVRLLVTLPSAAADDESFAMRLADLGVEAVRINCAHDDEAAWSRMMAHVETAAIKTGRRMKIMMDLAGPKIRTGAHREGKKHDRVHVGDELAITLPGQLDEVHGHLAAVECGHAEALAAVTTGQRIFIDDGKLTTRVLRRERYGVVVQVLTAPDDGEYRLRPEKGINLPDTALQVASLTDDDLAVLPFVARHADAIEFSFVQSHEDVALLQEKLAQEQPERWRSIGLVLKIETLRAVRNLPDMLVRAAGSQPTAVMIARGDLAVEIGFARLAEMQEELLWLCEAAHIPVIWATQVLESFVKTGVPSRGEMTDAAMAARAECVMLNKGPHLFEVIAELEQLLDRMSEHQRKKTSRLRPLRSW